MKNILQTILFALVAMAGFTSITKAGQQQQMPGPAVAPEAEELPSVQPLLVRQPGIRRVVCPLPAVAPEAEELPLLVRQPGIHRVAGQLVQQRPGFLQPSVIRGYEAFPLRGSNN